ncbi:MAG: hypothetical protein ACQESB_03875, partial [Elusimicrobiota bacterium]
MKIFKRKHAFVKALTAFMMAVTLIRGTAESFIRHKGRDEIIVDYEKYGEFRGIGTDDYKYQITDSRALGNAVGEGIFPNNWSVEGNPGYQEAKEEGLLEGLKWDFIHGVEPELAFYKWSTALADPGVRLFYTAEALNRAGYLEHAIKAYYAIVVNFPRTISWTYYDTPWYVGPVAIDKIEFLTRTNPELGVKLEDAYIRIENKYDNNPRT